MNFNERVWNACKKIPRGKVSTSKELAHAVNSNAYRAVGMAMNKNPSGLLNSKGKDMVPCHRVVNSQGHLHGFASGLRKKAEMLKKEGIKIKNNRIDLGKYRYKY